MLRRHPLRLIALSFLVIATALTPLNGGRVTPSRAAINQSSGIIPWHPHFAARMAAGLVASVDLADGHVDVQSADMSVGARGLDLSMSHTWDSFRSISAPCGGGILPSKYGTGWTTDQGQFIAGAGGQSVYYQDPSGACWSFLYFSPNYLTPNGLPWQLTYSGVFNLANLLTGEVRQFNGQGRYLSDTDAYTNANTLSYDPVKGFITSESNSGGRALTFAFASGPLSELKSPLWVSSSGVNGQHTTYAYTGSLLTGITRGAGTSDAKTTQFGYTGNLMTSVTTPGGHTWMLAYNGSNQLTSITSPAAGATPSYITQITYNTGSTQVVRGYGTSAALTSTYTLDSQGQATAVADGLSDTSHATYDSDHDLLTSTDANGNVTTNHFQYIGQGNSFGQLTETDQPAIHPNYPTNTATAPVVHYVYDPSSHDLTQTYDNNGMQRYFTYDGHHSVSSIAELVSTTVNGGTTTYHWRGQIPGYDAYGEQTSNIDGRGVSVPDTTGSTVPTVSANGQASSYTHSWTYSTQGDQLTSATPAIHTILPNGVGFFGAATITFGYDGDGEQTSVKSANGNTATFSFDRLGRLTGSVMPQITLYDNTTASPSASVSYDGDGNLATSSDGNGNHTSASYDPLGRPVSTTNQLNETTVITYSATTMTATRDPQGNVTTFQPDGAGRLHQVQDAAGEAQQYGYDNQSNVTSITRGNGVTATQSFTATYDALNQLSTSAIFGPSTPSQVTALSYDLHGHPVRAQQPNNDTGFGSLDLADQLTSAEQDPNGPNLPSHASQESFGYDTAANLQSGADWDSRQATLTLDGDNRLTQRVDSFGSSTLTTSPSYDPNGNVVNQTQTDGTHSHSFSAAFNAADWQTGTTDDGLATTYGYDKVGSLRTQTYGGGTEAITTDSAGRVTAIGDGTSSSSFGYNADDLLTSVGLPGGAGQGIQYDGASRLTQATTVGHSGNIATYGYGYDPTGWVNSISTTPSGGGTTTLALTHDALGHLTGGSGGGNTYSWGYADVNGHLTDNLASSSTNGTTTSYSYNNSTNPNELAGVSTTGQATINYSYDASGHTTGISNGGSINTGLSYDPQGRLTGITLANGTGIALTYNAVGQRANYTVTPSGASQPSLAEHFQYRGGDLAQIAYTGTSVTTPYTDTYLYRRDGAPYELLRLSGGTTSRYWYQLDGHGSVVALTDSGGNVVDSYSYDLWGMPSSVSETVPQQLRYAGYWYDNELAWYWLGVRYYDPGLKRFLQPDPSQQEGLFSYAYVGSDPADENDPSGLVSEPLRSAGSYDPGLCYVQYPQRDANGNDHEVEECARAYAEDAPEGDICVPCTPALCGVGGAVPAGMAEGAGIWPEPRGKAEGGNCGEREINLTYLGGGRVRVDLSARANGAIVGGRWDIFWLDARVRSGGGAQVRAKTEGSNFVNSNLFRLNGNWSTSVVLDDLWPNSTLTVKWTALKIIRVTGFGFLGPMLGGCESTNPNFGEQIKIPAWRS